MAQAKKKTQSVKGAFQELGLPKLPNVMMVKLDDLLIDGQYQRITSESRVEKYAKKFNPVCCNVLIISKRSSGKMFVVDGNHRRAALQKLGYKHWHSYVLEGLSSAQEAEYYEMLNVDRKNASAAERFKARLHYKDPIATTIKSTVERCGFHVVLEKVSHKDGRTIHAIGALDQIFRRSNQPIVGMKMRQEQRMPSP
jgi:hypothetical protein